MDIMYGGNYINIPNFSRKSQGKARHMRKDNIKVYLEIGCDVADWIQLSQGKVNGGLL
jgi:hypothetical protein